jgi:hypothetical protein
VSLYGSTTVDTLCKTVVLVLLTASLLLVLPAPRALLAVVAVVFVSDASATSCLASFVSFLFFLTVCCAELVMGE